MAAGFLSRIVETAPGQVLYRLATLPLVRPLARGLRRGGTRLAEAAIRRRPAHRRHDARQRAILAAFEAETAHRQPSPGGAPR
jgi:hypothetical protein